MESVKKLEGEGWGRRPANVAGDGAGGYVATWRGGGMGICVVGGVGWWRRGVCGGGGGVVLPGERDGRKTGGRGWGGGGLIELPNR